MIINEEKPTQLDKKRASLEIFRLLHSRKLFALILARIQMPMPRMSAIMGWTGHTKKAILQSPSNTKHMVMRSKKRNQKTP